MFTKQFDKNEAIQYGKSNKWKKLSLQQIARLGLFQTKLCVPFDKLHESVEKTMKRPVYTHEFATTYNEPLFYGVFKNMTRYDLF